MRESVVRTLGQRGVCVGGGRRRVAEPVLSIWADWLRSLLLYESSPERRHTGEEL